MAYYQAMQSRHAKTLSHLLFSSLVGLCSLCHAAPIDLPNLGDGASRLISPQLEQEIGSAFLKQLHASLPLVGDPILQYYVETQLADLVQYSNLRSPLQAVVIVDDEELNAFAAPGGIIGINLGLMIYARDLDEYASVMAHELAHLSQRHFARRVEAQQAASIPTLVSTIAAILVGFAGGSDAGLAALTTAQAMGQASQLRFSREREIEADRIGLNTLARANLDPAGMARMFERMQQAYRFTGKPPEFLLTHPLSESRINDAKSQARDYEKTPPRQARPERAEDYQLMRARAESRFSQNPRNEIKTYRKARSKNVDDAAVTYALALALSKNGEHVEAVNLMRGNYQADSNRVLMMAAFAELLIAAEQHREARQILERGLALYPDSYPLSMMLARAATAEKRYAVAEILLEGQSKRRPVDLSVWFELAETAGLAGNVTGVHLARAEYFFLNGAYHRAIQHLEYAKRLTPASNQQLNAKLSQRIQDLRVAMRRASS